MQKKYIFSLIILFQLVFNTNARTVGYQGQDERWKQGYVIPVEKQDTLKGLIKLRKGATKIYKMDFKETMESHARPYESGEIMSFKFGDDVYRSFGSFFAKQIIRDSLSYYIKDGSGVSSYSAPTMGANGMMMGGGGDPCPCKHIKLKGKKLFWITKAVFSEKIGNNKKLAEYLADNKELSIRILNDEFYYTDTDIEKMVKMYNTWKHTQ